MVQPSIRGGDLLRIVTAWPEVAPDDWCGEHEPERRPWGGTAALPPAPPPLAVGQVRETSDGRRLIVVAIEADGRAAVRDAQTGRLRVRAPGPVARLPVVGTVDVPAPERGEEP